MVKFFGKIDLNKHGKIASNVPAYMMDTHVEDLRETIAAKKRSIDRGEIPMDALSVTRAEIEKMSKRLQDIEESRPEITKEQQDKMWKAYDALGKGIKETLFTRSEMKMGLADPHEEARRCVNPIIEVKDENIAQLCEMNEVPIHKKRGSHFITRNDASRIWKWIGRYLGEPSNTESLRQDKITVRTARK